MKEFPLVNVRGYVHLVKGREHLRKRCVKVKVAQSCPTLCHTMDCSLPGSSVHEILQARILEWVAVPFSGDLPNPGIKPGSPALQADSLPSEPPRKPSFDD